MDIKPYDPFKRNYKCTDELVGAPTWLVGFWLVWQGGVYRPFVSFIPYNFRCFTTFASR